MTDGFAFAAADIRRGTTLALKSLTLTIRHDEKVALLGRSGAGKTSLLEALREQHPQQVAWCPQEGALVPILSVFHNIYMGALPRHGRLYNLTNLVWPLAAEKRAIAELAGQLGIAEKLTTSVDQLSGGQAQRTALGRALYTRRPILLGDEPVSSVDEHQALQLLEFALAQHRGAVIALHDRALALQCFDRVIGLSAGELVLDAPAAGLSLGDLDQLYQ